MCYEDTENVVESRSTGTGDGNGNGNATKQFITMVVERFHGMAWRMGKREKRKRDAIIVGFAAGCLPANERPLLSPTVISKR